MPASGDTVLRILRHESTLEIPSPRVLGVDDWALRKRCSYGTILVDLERRRIVDLLPDRSTETLSRWLREHEGVEVVSRDRSGTYAEAITQAAPGAIQVADRWHLLKNLNDTMLKLLERHGPAMERRLEPVNGREPGEPGEAQPAGSLDGLSHTVPENRQATAADKRRQLRVEQAQHLRGLGWTVTAIARQLGYHPKTIRRYLNTPLPLLPQRRRRRQRLLDPYRAYLHRRWQEGCHNAAALFHEIRLQGYAGQRTTVRDYVRQWRTAGLCGAGEASPGSLQRQPSLRSLAWLIVRNPDSLSESEQELVRQVSASHPQLEKATALAQAFAEMVRQRQADQLGDWLEGAQGSGIGVLRRFAVSLRQDEAAVGAALSLPWSNGPTEGHVNRLKLLKRQMYGRAGLDLLRIRTLCRPP
jgi:transposase